MQALFVSPSCDMLKEVASGMLSEGGEGGFWGVVECRDEERRIQHRPMCIDMVPRTIGSI